MSTSSFASKTTHTPSSDLKVFCLFTHGAICQPATGQLQTLHLLISLIDFYSPLIVCSPMLLEHLCITARMGKRGKEAGGRINHYLLPEDTSGAPQCYHLAFEPIQLIKSTNYLFLLNPSFALIDLPFLFVWGIFVSKYCKMENSTHSHSLPFCFFPMLPPPLSLLFLSIFGWAYVENQPHYFFAHLLVFLQPQRCNALLTPCTVIQSVGKLLHFSASQLVSGIPKECTQLHSLTIKLMTSQC